MCPPENITELNSNNSDNEVTGIKTEDANEKQALDAIIEESKVRLSGEKQKGVKRGRGRPKKTEINVNSRDAAPVIAPAPLPDFTPILENVIALPYMGLAKKTGFDGWKLDNEEKTAQAKQLNEVCNQFAPDVMASKYASLTIFAISIITMSAFKYMSYREYLDNEQKKLAEESAKPEKVDATNPFVVEKAI